MFYPGERKGNAKALLQTVRDKLTGKEIEICERLADGNGYDDETGDSSPGGFRDRHVYQALEIQFSREIAAWKDGVPA